MTRPWATAEFGYMPAQDLVFRAVAGAVLNAAHGHPDWKLDRTIARSIAKRAAGTLTSSWSEVLAARQASSEQDGAHGLSGLRPARGSRRSDRANRGAPLRGGRSNRPPRRSPLKLLHNQVGALVRPAKHAGQSERVEALVEVLRLIGALRAQELAARGATGARAGGAEPGAGIAPGAQNALHGPPRAPQ